MKKLGIIVSTLLVIVWFSVTCYSIALGGVTYYVTIHNDGNRVLKKMRKQEWNNKPSKARILYEYNQAAYTETGKEKIIKFTASHNLRHGAFLKLTYNYSKGVTSWEEVKKSAVPKKALDNLKMEES